MQIATKKVNTNNRLFCLRVQSYIKSYHDERTLDSIRREVKSLMHPNLTVGEACIKWVEGGTLACYYSDVAKDLATLFRCTVEDIWSSFNDNETHLWDYYVKLMARELLHIVTKERCYID